MKTKGEALKILNKIEADNTAPASAKEAARSNFKAAKVQHQNQDHCIRLNMLASVCLFPSETLLDQNSGPLGNH